MTYTIRSLTAVDVGLLSEMVYEGLSGLAGQPRPPREIVQEPQYARYFESWGRAGDLGFVAHDDGTGELLGAVWVRQMAGEASGGLPELALSVKPGSRKRGLGTALLTHLVRSHPEQSAVRLHVGPGNPAIRLYERFGFKVAEVGDGVVTMRRD